MFYILSLPSTLPSYLKLFIERVLPRSLSSNVQLCSIKAVLNYIVGIINMLIKHPALLAKLQRTITKYKGKLICLSSRRVFVSWSSGNLFLTRYCLHSQWHFHVCPQKQCERCVVRSDILGTSQCYTSLSLPPFPLHKSFSDFHLSISFGKLESLGVGIIFVFQFSWVPMAFSEVLYGGCFGSVLSELTCVMSF